MTIDKVKKFFQDNKAAIMLPVAVGIAAGTTVLISYRQGMLDFAREHATDIADGEAFQELADYARQSDVPFPFSWRYDDTGEIIEYTVKKKVK